MKKLFTTTLGIIALGISTMWGASPVKMHIEQNDGTLSDYTVTENLTIKFSGTPISFVGMESQANMFDIPLSTIKRIYFNDPAGIENLTATPAETLRLACNPVGSTLELVGNITAPGELSVWSTDGRRVVAVANWSGQTVDVSALFPGIYIVTINNTAIKFIKK